MHVHSILQIEIQSLMLDAAALGPTLTGYEATEMTGTVQ